jgi:hypothetical protein
MFCAQHQIVTIFLKLWHIVQDNIEELKGELYEMYRNVPGLGQKKFWLNLLSFGCHLLQNCLLWNVLRDPIIFSMLQKRIGSEFP